MPLVLELVETNPQLPLKKIPGVEGVVSKDVLDTEELRLAIHDHAGVRGNVALAVSESVEGVDGLVRRHVVGKVDDNLDLVRGHVLDLLDFDLAFILCLDDRILYDLRGLSVRNLGDGDGVLVDLLYLGADLDAAASRSIFIIAAVGASTGGEVGVDREVLAFEDVHRRVQ